MHHASLLMPLLALAVVLPDAASSQTGSALEDIINANTKSGILAKPNVDGSGDGLFEGDIILHSRSRTKVFGGKNGLQFGATGILEELWPNRTVYYTMSDDILKERGNFTKLAIAAAIKEIQDKTCIKIVPRNRERDYVHFFKGGGCWSNIGRVGAKQEISIGIGCEYMGVVAHELMHSLGFWHEQSRPDRDTHVEIIFENVMQGYESQFKKYDTGQINSRGSPYDFKSLMHYGAKAFSKNAKDTVRILQKNSTVVPGQRRGLSDIDVEQLKQLYKCHRTNCDFEKDFCSWENKAGDQFDWSRNSGATPSPYTGPSGDHTKGDSTGFYAFIEASGPRSLGHVARLQSPTIAGSSTPRCFRFWYSMKGYHMGSIKVDMEIESVLLPMWILSGNQGSNWNPASFSIPESALQSKIIISGVVGRGYRGDAAIDDISITDGACAILPSIAKPVIPTTEQKPTTELPTTVQRSTTEIPSTMQSSTTELPTTMQRSTTELPTTMQSSTTELPTTMQRSTTELPTTEQIITTQLPTTKLRTTTKKPTTAATPQATTPAENDFFCDFESECETWQTAAGETKWFRNFGRTPSSSTGPAVDHTFGIKEAHYLYLETSPPRKFGDRARLVSRPLPFNELRCLEFFYFMYGRDINELNVYMTSTASSKDVLIWTLKGQQGRIWSKAKVPLPSASIGSKVMIEGKVGSSHRGDIAIDDISFQAGSCESMPTSATVEIKTTMAPTPPLPTTQVPPSNVIQVEVIAEGCNDPVVRQRTLAALKAANVRTRNKRNPQYDEDYFGGNEDEDGSEVDEDEDQDGPGSEVDEDEDQDGPGSEVDESENANKGRDIFREWLMGGRKNKGGLRNKGGRKPKGRKKSRGKNKKRLWDRFRKGPRKNNRKGGPRGGKWRKKRPTGGRKKKPSGGNKKKPGKPDKIKPTRRPDATTPRFVKNDCKLARSSIKVNGQEYSPQRPGHNVVAIRISTGLPYAQKNFPTNYNFRAGPDMQRFIQKLSPDSIIAISTQDTADAAYLGERILREIGAKTPYYPDRKGSWAFIGYKGTGKVDWIQQQTRISGQGPSKVSATVARPKKRKPVTIRTLLRNAVFTGKQYLPIPARYNKLLDFGFADFTISAWIKTTQGGTIISKAGPESSLDPYLYIKLIYVEDGYVKVRVGKKVKVSSVKVDKGEWTHIAVAVKAARRPHMGALYINGKEDASFSFDAVPDFDDYVVKVAYGMEKFPLKSAFVGQMRHVTYYNTALKKEEVFDVANKIRAAAQVEKVKMADSVGSLLPIL